mmetsp:Transcript_13274/g.36639  ORF Transcript_13274/g.36639 Transcript_13274/m.36639 type:complete len:422 (-) Transcript_13274:27-1292(-)
MTERNVKEPELRICSVNDYEDLARRRLSKDRYEYVASGANEEQTLAENRGAFQEWYLRPRVLRHMGNLSTQTTIRMGNQTFSLELPLFTSAAGLQGLLDPTGGGECHSAAAAVRAGIPFGISQHSTQTIEDIAEAATEAAAAAAAARSANDPNRNPPMLWYQSYLLKQRQVSRDLVQRARAAGCRAILLTVDSVRLGYREADARNGFDSLPKDVRLVNYDKYSQLAETYNSKQHAGFNQNVSLLFEQDLDWKLVEWMKRELCQDLPLVLKGVMTGEDAILAVGAGADALIVSNHGGRQLDGSLAAIDALPEVVQAVRDLKSKHHGLPIPVFVEGGIRRGTDILKALALGASAVGIGKPVFFALASGNGSQGVQHMLQLLRKELENAMALTGCQTVEDISPSIIMRHPSGSGRPAAVIRSAL